MIKIINPYKDKEIPALLIDEPFMLWCPERKVYYRVVIAHWYSSYVARDMQLGTHALAFTIAKKDYASNDAHSSIAVIQKLLVDNNYVFNFKDYGR